jgi:hypothetical protein
MNDRCLPSGANPGGSAFHLVARVKVSRVFRKQVLTCSNSLVSAKPYFGKPPKKRSAFTTTRAAQLGSLRPTIFCRNEIGWIAACTCCAAAKPDAMRAAKSAEVK